MMCFAVCAPLQSYLGKLGLSTELIKGEVNGNEHYWLQFPDGRIIDPTADQFFTERMMPKVYIGDRPPWYQVEMFPAAGPAPEPERQDGLRDS